MFPKIPAALVAFTAVLALSAWIPSTARADEFSAPELPATMTLQGGASPDFLDVAALEFGVSAGILAYSSDFESDPKFAASLSLRAPLPWLSREVLGFERDALGLFVQTTISSIDRDFDQPLQNPDGITFFGTLGLDFAILRDDGFILLAQLGVQYASFGSVTDTDNGAGLLIGLVGGVEVTKGLSITLNPQVSFGSGGDLIFFGLVGVLLSF